MWRPGVGLGTPGIGISIARSMRERDRLGGTGSRPSRHSGFTDLVCRRSRSQHALPVGPAVDEHRRRPVAGSQVESSSVSNPSTRTHSTAIGHWAGGSAAAQHRDARPTRLHCPATTSSAACRQAEWACVSAPPGFATSWVRRSRWAALPATHGGNETTGKRALARARTARRVEGHGEVSPKLPLTPGNAAMTRLCRAAYRAARLALIATPP